MRYAVGWCCGCAETDFGCLHVELHAQDALRHAAWQVSLRAEGECESKFASVYERPYIWYIVSVRLCVCVCNVVLCRGACACAFAASGMHTLVFVSMFACTCVQTCILCVCVFSLGCVLHASVRMYAARLFVHSRATACVCRGPGRWRVRVRTLPCHLHVPPRCALPIAFITSVCVEGGTPLSVHADDLCVFFGYY